MKRLPLLSGLILVLGFASADAAVVRFEVVSREPFASGMTFGETGSYEKIVGRVHYELDPSLPANTGLVDLQHAPRNDRGKVEFWADLFVLAPSDPARGNGAVLYDVNNRGNKLALGIFNSAGGNNPTTAEHAGDGFLMRQGFTVVWSGWDGELLPGGDRLRLAAPVARTEPPITGLVRCEFIPTGPARRMVVNWANHGSYRPTEPGARTATLTVRPRPGAPRQPVPRDTWKLHVTDISSDAASQLPSVEVEFLGEMQSGALYELIYEASDPLVMGVGFAAVRDLISALKSGTGAANPLLHNGQPWVRRAHGFGVSQSGRFLREFLHAGFNADEQGRQVFDGLIPHVAGGGLGSFNHRFAQPTRHSNQHDHHDYPPDRFPFAYDVQTDPLSGQVDGILRRAGSSGTCPRVLHTQSAAEYWTRSGSLPHTDPLGLRDAPVPENVRFYSFGGTQHGPAGWPVRPGPGQWPPNPADFRPFLRCLLLALDRWTRDGTEPPPSVYPRIAEGTLVDWRPEGTGFPVVPGVRYPEVIQQPHWLDFGPRWLTDGWVERQPPRILGDYRVLVPRSDPDGNDQGCLAPPEVAVPIATYTGWSIRSDQSVADGQLVSLTGSYIPFARTPEERKAAGDPRLSVQERYASQAAYLQKLTEECRRLQQSGYLLEEDIGRIVDRQRTRTEDLFR